MHPFKYELCDIPAGLAVRPGDAVVIQDDEGEDLGEFVCYEESTEGRSVVLRKASVEDLGRRAELHERAREALAVFRRVRDSQRPGGELDGAVGNMRVVGAHWRYDRKRIWFYFASEERFDFRSLQKAVATALRTRVAIKQVGVRDYARVLGGLGPCGRDLCCRCFVRNLKPIALRMARQQNLFVEPSKISGICGKLLCCLGFEEGSYQEWLRDLPLNGTRVVTERGPGIVTGADGVRRRIHIRYDDGTDGSVALEELLRPNERGLRTEMRDP